MKATTSKISVERILDLEGRGDECVVPTRQMAVEIHGQQTEVICQSFRDRVVVLITQVGRVGCLIQATTSVPAHYMPTRGSGESDEEGSLPPDLDGEGKESSIITSSLRKLPPPFPGTVLTRLLGTPPKGYSGLYSLYASQVASIVGWQTRGEKGATGLEACDSRPVVVGLSLKIREPSNRKEGEEELFDDEDDEGLVLDDFERERFARIMDLVIKTRVW
ncbi:hypothetical protein IE53DRAFT_387280 [Violaceomyces palustris]|uniref:Uncharacterized protein n=1 Tax=Violaceomyces palustris TaxID=1673888 RepID=A0ACD0NX42_9BASI|nr:hypothetical protein IE53DRAFT_387280 [Violaceomyces palustris]